MPTRNQLNRRSFLKHTAALGGALGIGAAGVSALRAATGRPPFKISLAEWSFHRTLFSGNMSNLDFPKVAKRDYGIDTVEYVNQFWKDKARDQAYLAELKKRCDNEGVTNRLIMCDGEGALGDPDEARRRQAVENHHKWVEAARFLGCESIRVNAETNGVGSFEEQQKRAADGLRLLSEFGAQHGINVIVENHGHLSSNGKWLAGVMKRVNLPNCGTLPDFGNFTEYDRYQGVAEMMPFAKAVSAKSHDFDKSGNESGIDYRRMIQIVLDAGYHSYLGIEYEGEHLPEPEGVRATKALLEKILKELST